MLPGGGAITEFPVATGPAGGVSLSSLGDDGDDWWGGAQRCMVGVAQAIGIAAVALSSALAQRVATPHEDFVAPAPSGSHTAPIQAMRAQVGPMFFRWGGGDEFVAPAPTAALDDAAFDAPQPRELDTLVLVWSGGGDEAIPALQAAEDEYQPPLVLPARAAAQPPLDPGDFAPAAAQTAEDEDCAWPPPGPAAPPPVLLPAWHTDEVPQQPALDADDRAAAWVSAPRAWLLEPWQQDELAILTVEEDAWLPWAPAAARPAPWVWSESGDEFAQQAATLAAEDDWLPAAPRAVAPVLALPAWQDEIAQAPELTVDEDAWQPPTPAAPRAALAPAYDDAAVPQQAAAALEDDAAAPLPAPRAAPWLLTQWHQDELPALTVDEDGWQPRPWPAATVPPAATADDDFAPAPTALDDGAASPAAPALLAPVLRSWLGDDEVPQAAAPLPVDEAYLWPPLPVMPPTTSLWVAGDSEDAPELVAPPEPPAPPPAAAPTPAEGGWKRKKLPPWAKQPEAMRSVVRDAPTPAPTRDPFMAMLLREDDDLVRLVRELYESGGFEPR